MMYLEVIEVFMVEFTNLVYRLDELVRESKC